MRRSEEEAVDVINMGMSLAVVMDGGGGGGGGGMAALLPYGRI